MDKGKTEAKKPAVKRNTKRFSGKKWVLKGRRFILDCKKWLKKFKRKAARKVLPVVGALDQAYETPEPPKQFFSLFKILTFAILFLGVGGAYIWVQIVHYYMGDAGGIYHYFQRQHAGPEVPTSIAKQPVAVVPPQANVVKAPLVPDPSFTMQPSLKTNTKLSLINTINPQFFIQASDNQVQKVAILIVGLGINQGLTDQITTTVSPKVSLVFSPYTPDLEDEIDFASYDGFTVLVATPLEDEDAVTDFGYLTLKTRVSEQENIANLKKIVAAAPAADCLYGQGGGRLLRSPKDLAPILKLMREINNCFVAPPDLLVNRLHEVAAATKLNYVCTTIENPTDSMLPSIEALTQRTGFAVLAFDAKPGVIEEVNRWIKSLEAAKITLVPITEIIHH